ncbi:MAG: hypothetical protein LAO06_02705 [Acidobacteriia bacterium]|nr:hypothetical protein [Terriglobia bacterium]
MKFSKIVLSVIAAGLLVPAVFAQDVKPGPIQQRKHNQQRRIAQGVRSGSLTPREGARLERNEARINREERRMKADGNFTPQERQRILRQQNALSRQIYRQKHDAQQR